MEITVKGRRKNEVYILTEDRKDKGIYNRIIGNIWIHFNFNTTEQNSALVYHTLDNMRSWQKIAELKFDPRISNVDAIILGVFTFVFNRSFKVSIK